MDDQQSPAIENVVDMSRFHEKRPEWVWECKCSSQLFFLNKDGTIECRSCKTIPTSIEWVFKDHC